MAYYGETDYSLDFSDRDLYFPCHYDLYCKLGEYLSEDEVKLLTYLLGNVLDDDAKSRIHCGRDLFLVMEERNICNNEILRRIAKLLKIIHRFDVIPYLHVTGKRKVAVDPLEEYIKANETQNVPDSDYMMPMKRRKLDGDVNDNQNRIDSINSNRLQEPASNIPVNRRDESYNTNGSWQIKEKYTCDVRLRVRAEYCSHDAALRDNVASNRQHELERKFECFIQANNILKTRDLGYIICDIKFSEITYLDAFWRDYLNGSLLEALKGVFITESLKQAVGNEAVKLLVHVDEDDYERGRITLLQNFHL